MKTLSISTGASDLLGDMAHAQGVTKRAYLEALLHYAGSCHFRPGSWEANTPFDYSRYDESNLDSNGLGTFADRWFDTEQTA
jgi:hypothetical protein